MVLGVALGVAVVVAIDLANGSAMAAFGLSTEAVTGRSTHRIVAANREQDLDEARLQQIRVDLGLRASAPVIETSVQVQAFEGATFTLLGVDPLSEAPFRSLLGGDETAGGDETGDDLLAQMITVPGAVFLGRDVAERGGIALGDPLVLEAAGRAVEARVAGLLEPADGLSRRALEGLILADIGTAQELLDRPGRIDRIDLILPSEPAALQEALAQIEPLLPASEGVELASEQQATVASMTEAFRLNLTALSMLALLVGTFLIFNTVRFSVVQRRRTLATLRALGVTRREIFATILVEAAVLGSLGSLLGLVMGVFLGRMAVVLVTQTINDLYFVVQVRGVDLQIASLARGALLGMGAALIAAIIPAYEATSVPPVSALRRSDAEARSRERAPKLLAAGIGLGLFGLLALAIPGERIDLGFLGMACIVFGFSLSVPCLTLLLMRAVAPFTGAAFGLVGRLAPRNVSRALSRTSVAVAALMVAVCVSIGVGVMVGSFRETVQLWLNDTLRADIFISPPTQSLTSMTQSIEPGLASRLGKLDGVTSWSTARRVRLQSPEIGDLDAVALLSDLAGDKRPYLDAIGPPGEVWEAVEDGAIVISEPLSRRHDLALGETLNLMTDQGAREFQIAGIFYDYGSERGVIYMADPVYRRLWDDERISSIALRLDPAIDGDAFAFDLQRDLAAAGEAALIVRSNRGLREEVLRIFDRAFAITTALRILAVAVAFIGILSALMALQLERAREFGTLRATGMTERELTGLSLLETGLVGASAGILSWPAGLSLALLLIYVINRRSFGWTIQTFFTPGIFISALFLAIVAALLAGIYPALRLRKLPIARVLREE